MIVGLPAEGACRHIVNGEVQVLKAGCLVFVRPDDTHRYEAEGDGDCRFLNIPCRPGLIGEALAYLNEEEFTRGVLGPALPRIAMLSRQEMDEFFRHIERYLMLCTIDRVKARIHLKGLLIDTLTRYFFSPETAGQPEFPLWLEHAVSKIQLKENLNQGLPALYKLSGRSPGHVNRAFRQYLNQTPTGYINQLRLNTARNLLLTTELRVVEIALEAGFENVSHFYHQFKKFYRQAPLDFRRNGQESRRLL
ncbi:helix-turn-helix domain-containing protein [Paenibacillus sp. FSL R7-0312]|uniref:AraC family transcriptional regulator n=1 Tax=Paenibacillus sp. FSL R7-0312 TaxID=2921682 RepID=UPI0030F8B574